MADPHIVEELDSFDRFTIRCYRTGLALAAAGLALAAGSLFSGRSPANALTLTAFATVLSVSNMHLYDKRVRWVIASLAWSSLLTFAISEVSPRVLGTLALGLMLAALSALVLKEWFCFRLPGVQATPIVLALGTFARFGGYDGLASVCFLLGALGVGLVTIAKLRMPLTHDLGARAHYQI